MGISLNASAWRCSDEAIMIFDEIRIDGLEDEISWISKNRGFRKLWSRAGLDWRRFQVVGPAKEIVHEDRWMEKKTVTREMKALERSQTARVSWHNDGDNGHRWKFARRRDAEAFVSVMRAGNKNLSSRFHGGNVARRWISRTGKFPRNVLTFFPPPSLLPSFSMRSTFLELI